MIIKKETTFIFNESEAQAIALMIGNLTLDDMIDLGINEGLASSMQDAYLRLSDEIDL